MASDDRKKAEYSGVLVVYVCWLLVHNLKETPDALLTDLNTNFATKQ